MTISQAISGCLIISHRDYRAYFSQSLKRYVVYHRHEIIATFRYKSHLLGFMKTLAPLSRWTFQQGGF